MIKQCILIKKTKKTSGNKVRTQVQDFLRLCAGNEKCYVNVTLYVIRFWLICMKVPKLLVMQRIRENWSMI